MLRTLVAAVSILSFASAQLPPVLVGRKVVTFEQGGMWWASHVLHTNGTVRARGNPDLGGGSVLLPLSGVNDLARLDAATPGEGERVAMVGTNGVHMVKRNDVTLQFDITTWSDSALLGALKVRATRIGAQYLVGVLTANGSTLRFHRGNGQYVATFAVGQPVLDFEVFPYGVNDARVFVLTSQGVQCTSTTGTVHWSLAGSDGDLVRWPSGTPRAGWVHHNANGAWSIDLLGEAGVARTASLGAHMANNEGLIAAMAADCNSDTRVDLIVRTPDRMFTLRADDTDTSFLTEPGLPTRIYTQSELCIPDLAITHRGRHVRLVDYYTSSPLHDTQLVFGADGSWDHGIEPYDATVHESMVTDHTRLACDTVISEQWMQDFVVPGKQTHVQIVSWLDEDPDDADLGSDTPQSNRLSLLCGIPLPVDQDTIWPLRLDVDTDWTVEGNLPGWPSPHHYWLTLRLVVTEINSQAPVSTSDPVTFLMTMSHAQRADGWPYIQRFADPGDWHSIVWPGPPTGGGVTVGVITLSSERPPTTTIPSPRDATIGPQSPM